jgi:hypothetical protein
MDSDEGEQEEEEEEEGEIDTNELLADLEDCFGSDEKCSENISRCFICQQLSL